MATFDLEAFKKIPRNDILIYLHQYCMLNKEIKIADLYDRINKPTYIFCSIIDDLIRLKLIICTSYSSSRDKGSFFPDDFKRMDIQLTKLGEDYVESKLFGYNLTKYDKNDPLDSYKFFNISGTLSSLCFKSFDEINKQFSQSIFDIVNFYFILTGKNYKENKNKKIFISYSWDNETHKLWIEKLANDLSIYFKVEYDKKLEVSMSPSKYMKHNILSSDYVIIVFTKGYNERITKPKTGVNVEFSLIQEDLFRKISTNKFIPILKEGSKNESIPEIMQDAIYADFRLEETYQTSINKIIEIISK